MIQGPPAPSRLLFQLFQLFTLLTIPCQLTAPAQLFTRLPASSLHLPAQLPSFQLEGESISSDLHRPGFLHLPTRLSWASFRQTSARRTLEHTSTFLYISLINIQGPSQAGHQLQCAPPACSCFCSSTPAHCPLTGHTCAPLVSTPCLQLPPWGGAPPWIRTNLLWTHWTHS